MKSIELVLVIVVSAIIAGYIISYLIPLRKVEPKEITFDALREILVNLNNFKEFSLPSEAVVEVKSATLVLNGIEINASQVFLVWKSEESVVLQGAYKGETWSIWANSSCIGVISWVAIQDNGVELKIVFFTSSEKGLKHISYSSSKVVFRGAFRNLRVFFNGIKVYEAEGFRKVLVEEISIKG